MINPTPFETVLKINAHLLFACLFAAAAWWLWPTRGDLWALGLISIMFGIVSVKEAMLALKAMSKIHNRTRIVFGYIAKVREPESARLTDREALRRAGMIDD